MRKIKTTAKVSTYMVFFPSSGKERSNFTLHDYRHCCGFPNAPSSTCTCITINIHGKNGGHQREKQ